MPCVWPPALGVLVRASIRRKRCDSDVSCRFSSIRPGRRLQAAISLKDFMHRTRVLHLYRNLLKALGRRGRGPWPNSRRFQGRRPPVRPALHPHAVVGRRASTALPPKLRLGRQKSRQHRVGRAHPPRDARGAVAKASGPRLAVGTKPQVKDIINKMYKPFPAHSFYFDQ
ncbi:unnamed protein product [Phaeothamnion confervicola]